ncbi:hypothetical protein FRX31_019182 [Thalictrum thalictroides]|uniref:Uncharacterized protein n=1 Tax=Thalictrum thalictroides TaxID=46969 RepID=A0A7J6W4I3_THATH|nr:hypothetical protein FRX31_019182 [Thalictrum thalictroides]
MKEDDEGESRRQKAKEIAKMASTAMEEGGSSHLSMTLFIHDIKHQARKKILSHEQKTTCCNESFQ